MIQVKVAYISNKPSLVVEYAFVGLSANATFGDSGGIMSTARLELRGKSCDDAQSRA